MTTYNIGDRVEAHYIGGAPGSIGYGVITSFDGTGYYMQLDNGSTAYIVSPDQMLTLISPAPVPTPPPIEENPVEEEPSSSSSIVAAIIIIVGLSILYSAFARR